jgi:hypothetical protein
VYEEAHLEINPLPPPMTYLVDWDSMDSEIREIRWEQGVDQEPDPILVVSYYREAGVHLSLMYLAQAEGIPIPSSEVKGLLLLDKEDIHALCGEPVTLGQYLNRGGRALFSESFDTALVLEPFAQLRLLSEILRRQEKPEVG